MDLISQKILMGAAGVGGQEFFGAKLSSGSVSSFGVSPSNEIYLRRSTDNSYYKYNDNNLNSLAWSKTFDPLNTPSQDEIVFLSNGNAVIATRVSTLSGNTWTRGLRIGVINPAGSVNSTVESVASGTDSTVLPNIQSGLFVDASDAIYINVTGGKVTSVFKFNSSLQFQLMRQIVGTSISGTSENGMGNNAAGRYVVGWIQVRNDRFDAYFRVFNGTTNTLGRSIIFESSGNTNLYCYGKHCIDEDNNVFPAMFQGGGSQNTRGVFMFFNSSGSVLWQKRTVEVNSRPKAVKKGPDGFFYIAGYMSNPVRPLIIKMDGQGNVIWQRVITFNETTNASNYLRNIYFDSEDAFYVVSNNWIFKLPTDGSLTGAYSGFSYSDPGFTFTNSTHTPSNSTGSSSRTYTHTTPSVTATDVAPVGFNKEYI